MSNLNFKDIINFVNSKDFIELDKYYKGIRTLDLFNYYGQENPHTNFLANLFREDNPYTNNNYPLKLLLGLLSIAPEFSGNENLLEERNNEYKEIKDLYLNYKEISKLKVYSQTAFGGSKYKPDIRIEFKAEDKDYIIIIECKILAEENAKKEYNQTEYKQTELYRAICENKYDKEKCKAYYVFLSADNNIKISDQENWVKISYQDLVDYVLYPCSIESADINIPLTIEEYIDSYSNSYFKEKGNALKLAITPKEKELVKNMWKEYHDIIIEVLNILTKDKTEEDTIIDKLYNDKAMMLFSIYYILNYLDNKKVTDDEIKKLLNKRPIYYFDNKPYYTIVGFIYAVLQDILNSVDIKIFDDIPDAIIGKKYPCPRLASSYENISDNNKKYFDVNRYSKYPLTLRNSNEKIYYATSYINGDLELFIKDAVEEYAKYKDRIK